MAEQVISNEPKVISRQPVGHPYETEWGGKPMLAQNYQVITEHPGIIHTREEAGKVISGPAVRIHLETEYSDSKQ